ncbi:hypothetical protein K1719_030785 [Acacia pycnantha]|nr:hypothetical protein K1719_030785 [Acacia pycnantha]
MEGMMQNQLQQPQQQPQPQQPQPAAEKLNQAVQQLLNLEQVKTRTISLFKAISGILEDFDAYARTNTNPNGLCLSGDQRHITPALPMHLADVLTVHEAPQPFADTSGTHMKNTPLTSNNMVGPNSLLQILASSMPYANSARSSTNMMNTPSPQQQQPQPLTQQQQRQKLMQLPQHQQQQLLAQQQLRQSAMQGMGQTIVACDAIKNVIYSVFSMYKLSHSLGISLQSLILEAVIQKRNLVLLKRSLAGRCREKGGEGVDDAKMEYLRLLDLKLTGRGEGGVGGDDVGES